jgi:hypothetical protein
MMFAAPDPVASGRQFEVVAVHGRTPHVLADFVGDAVFTLHWENQDRLVAGSGRPEGPDTVRFTEKDVAHGGKDVRVWSIGQGVQPGQFLAWTTR